MIVGIGDGTFMLREAAGVALVIGGRTGSGSNGPTISASARHAGRPGDRQRRRSAISPTRTTTSSTCSIGARPYRPWWATERVDFQETTAWPSNAQLDTPDGVALAPDGDLIVADSHNDRIRRVDRATRIITTIAGSGETGYDGDGKPAIEAALNTPNAVWATPNGDIYIADTFNNRVRMIDHATGFIQTVAGDGEPGGSGPLGDGGPATSAHLFMPSDIALARNGDLYIADMHHNRIRKMDAKTKIITTVAGNGVFGQSGRRPGDGGKLWPDRPASLWSKSRSER